MSRLLVLLPSVPARLDSGARIRNEGLLNLLRRDHEVDAIAFASDDVDPSALADMANRTRVIPLPRRRSTLQRVADMARTDLPDMALRLWSLEFMRAVQCFVSERAYDAVQAEGIEMAPYLESVRPRRRIYDAHNAEFLMQRRLAIGGSLPARMYSRVQWRRLERFEAKVVQQSALTLAVSNHDANQLLALAGPTARVRVVPNGIDTARYPFSVPPTEWQPSLLFLGTLDYRPNSEALKWFIDDVMRNLPGVRLFAVGGRPPRWLVEAGQHDQRIAVTGYVNHEQSYIQRCGALVLPMRTGGGSRLKALVAMASGLPIVSTRLGMEGVEAEPEMHYLRADSAAEWLVAIGRLRSEPAMRQRLARNARALVEQRYDWQVLHGELRAAYACIDA